MGNSASCAPSITISNGGVVKLLHSDGALQIYTKPVKAGDLTAANPGEFVCDYGSLRIGQRITGLSADERLQRRRIYFLLPTDLLYSVLTEEEMSILSSKASKAAKYNQYFSRIFPVSIGEFRGFQSEDKSSMEISSSCSSISSFSPLISFSKSGVERSICKQRSWTPALETIVEAPSRSFSF